MSVTNARWIGTKEDATGAMVPYCTRCGADGWSIGDIHHTPSCLVPLVTKQAAIIVGFTEQVGDLKAALAASEQRAAAAEAHKEALGLLVQEILDDEPTVTESGGDRCVFCGALLYDDADGADGGEPHAEDCWIVRADADLAIPPRPEPPATLHDLIHQAEADRDEQSGTAAEEWCGGYLKGLRDALDALSATPLPAAPSVPDAAGAARLREILEEIEPRMVTILHDQETPLYACRDCHRVGSDAAANVEHAAWCIVTVARAALAPAAQRAPASTVPGDAKAGDDQ